MNVVYFNSPVGTNKVVYTITDRTVDELKQEGVIEATATTLVKPYNEDMKAEEFAKHVHIDKVVFDDEDNPTDIVFDLELLQAYYLDIFKQLRGHALKMLDGFQTRALATNNTTLVADIEADKQALRDMPDDLDYSDCTTAVDVARTYPQALMVDYEEKYTARFSE
jgi:hypothetical protein